jgi:hypothetical protein
MRFAFFAFFENTESSTLAASKGDVAAVAEILRRTPSMTSANLYTPSATKDMFNKDEAPPVLGMQLYFNELSDLEGAISPKGHLQQLVEPGVLSSLEGARATQQAMVVRPFPVDDPVIRDEPGELPCSYVVHYAGPAEDMNVWLHHYVSHHPQIMRTFPEVRHVEVLSRLDWCGFLPWERVNHMQRNRVMFDSPSALTAALQSPARIAMREDFKTFPPFSGGNSHYPLGTEIIVP